MFKSLGAAAAAFAFITTSTPINAACWNREETSAATIRDFQSLLMVATLRCRAGGLDMTDAYNRFISSNRLLVEQENERLKGHFLRELGPVAGQTAYDAFATHLANGYGDGDSSLGGCENASALAREAALMQGSEDGLLLLAARQGINTTLPGTSCERQVAENDAVAERVDAPPPPPRYAYAAPVRYVYVYPAPVPYGYYYRYRYGR